MKFWPKISITFPWNEKRQASKKEISEVTSSSYAAGAYSLWRESNSTPMLLSTVYRCVDLISDSVAVLPLKIYSVDQQGYKTENKKHPAYRKLNSEPNEDMTRYVFLKTLMSSVLLTGNGYAYIERRQDLKLEQLVFIPSSQVGIEWVIDSEGIRRKRYRVQGFKELVSPAEMIHVLNFTYDGIIGVSTLTQICSELLKWVFLKDY